MQLFVRIDADPESRRCMYRGSFTKRGEAQLEA